MKLALITDLHLGARSDSLIICRHQIEFFKNVFFPYLEENNIDTVICLGDLFDRRKYTNHAIFHEWEKEVFVYMARNNISFYIILGNHDVAYRNTLSVNSPELFLRDYDNITIIDEPTELTVDKLKILLCPWICAENEASTFHTIENTKAKVCMGHFDIAGFEMHRGSISVDGITKDVFQKFTSVFSGHFHRRNDDGRINYIGNPYDLTWADYGDARGFAVFDSTTLEVEYIDNPSPIHIKLFYNDEGHGSDYLDRFDLTAMDGKYVKLVVVKKTDLYMFDQLLSQLYSMSLADLKIIEEIEEVDAESVDDEKLDLQDTMTLVETYVDSIEIEGNKDKLKSALKTLYLEALTR